jgi:hypothetical protein
MFAILHAFGMFVDDLFKSRWRLEAENLFLRHQLNIASRRAPGGQLGSYTAAELKGHCEVHGFDARPARGDIPHRVGDITDPGA